MTVAENIVMGKPPHAKMVWLIKSIEIVEEISKKYNLIVNPSALVKELPVRPAAEGRDFKSIISGSKYIDYGWAHGSIDATEINQLFITLDELRNQENPLF